MASCLIIDRDEAFRALAQATLVADGHTVRLADGAADAARALACAPIDLVLVEEGLRDERGRSLVRELARPELDLCVLATAASDLAARRAALRAGAADHMAKPGSPEELLVSVDRGLRHQSLRRQARREARRAQAWAEEREAMLDLVSQVGLDRPLEESLAEVLEQTCARFGAAAGAVFLYDVTGDALVRRAARGLRADAPTFLEAGRGLTWWCFQRRAVIELDDPHGDSRRDLAVDEPRATPLANLLLAAIPHSGETLGVLALYDRSGKREGLADGSRLGDLAGLLGLVIRRAIEAGDGRRARGELHRLARELERVVDLRARAEREAGEPRGAGACREDPGWHARAKAANLERMELLGQVAAGLAHEINNPLSFVSANLGALEQHTRSLRRLAGRVLHGRTRCGSGAGVLGGEQRLLELEALARQERLPEVLDEVGPLFEETRTGLERITLAVDALRAFAEDVDLSGQPTLVDLNQEIQRILLLLQGSGLRLLEIDARLGPLPPQRLSALAVRQLLLELFGQVLRRACKRLAVSTGQAGGRVWLRLEAPGAEFSADELANVFETRSAQAPDGEPRLRLWMARDTAAQLGGQLDAGELPGGGLRVCVDLPIAADQEVAS